MVMGYYEMSPPTLQNTWQVSTLKDEILLALSKRLLLDLGIDFCSIGQSLRLRAQQTAMASFLNMWGYRSAKPIAYPLACFKPINFQKTVIAFLNIPPAFSVVILSHL